MSKFYHVIRDGSGKWIKSPNNGGECCQSQEDTVEELNRLLKQLEESEKLRVEYREALKAAGDALDDRIGCGCGASGPCMRCRKASENWEMAKGRKP